MSKIYISKGRKGWGGPLAIEVTEKEKDVKKVLSMTSGGVHPLAQHIAYMLGVEAVDGMKKAVADEDIACVVINCGGTLRCGVYPQKRVPTVNITPVGKSGPLSQYISEDIYVSDASIKTVGTEEKELPVKTESLMESKARGKAQIQEMKGFIGFISKVGVGVGSVIALFFQAGKEAVDVCITRVIPFMAFVSIFIALVQKTSIGTIIANGLAPLSGSLVGLLLLAVICGLPFLSPILGPGAAIAQVVGVLIGTNIGLGLISPIYALPALFAINVQVGADFVPVGLSMQSAEPETIELGTPAFLLSRQLTGPLAVLIAWLCSFGLF